MARDSSGSQNQPQYSASGIPADAADLSEVANYAAAVGNRKRDTAAARGAATGADVWDGLQWYETDTGDTYLRDAGAWLFKEARGTVTLPTPQTGWSILTGTETIRAGRMVFFHWVFQKNAQLTLPNELILVLPSGLRPVDTVWQFTAVVTGGSEAPSMMTINSSDGGVRIPLVPSSGARSFKADGHFFLS